MAIAGNVAALELAAKYSGNSRRDDASVTVLRFSRCEARQASVALQNAFAFEIMAVRP
ncbi:hypothetical protein [Caballeronia sp. 15715]|jgi:hypothetical protein|uniref:hypothetical protein n=1 Tax=unclassified Caballeronia TaxID=2646786 RepID=UPI0039E4B207